MGPARIPIPLASPLAHSPGPLAGLLAHSPGPLAGLLAHPVVGASPAADAPSSSRDASHEDAMLDHEHLAFVAPWERRALLDAWMREGLLVVQVDAPGPEMRGRLAEVIDEAIEQALALARAGAPGLDAARDPLADRIFRARRMGRAGLAVAMGTLRGIAESGALDHADARVVRGLIDAARGRPLRIALSLDDVIEAVSPPLAPIFAPTTTRELALEPTRELALEPACELALESAPSEPPASVPEAMVAASDFAEPDVEATWVDAPVAPIAPPAAPVAPMVPIAPPPKPRDDDSWRAWALALTAARGPQPLAAFEKMFIQAYVPLASRIAEGLDDPRAKQAAQGFRHAFSEAYADAFPTFAWTGKRPRMVLDAPQIALRLAREHHARTTQLVLVDSLRWDLGTRAFEVMERALEGRAVAVSSPQVLYSSIPTVTPRQIQTLARGEAALREIPEPESELLPVRRRGTETFRRMRLAGREIDKLDRIELHLRDLGVRAAEGLGELGRTTGELLAEYVASLAPRTLVLVFGDHGFCIDASGAARQGGTSPEEVLVPTFAFVAHELH